MDADLLSTDRALLARFRNGEREALVAVWQAYFPLVVSLARRGFGPYSGFRSPSDVDDAVAATFAAAFEEGSRLRYDGVTPFGSFLLGIGRNVMRRQMKKVAREPVYEGDLATRERSHVHTPEERLLRAEERELLSRFPETLSKPEQTIFHGYYRDGLSEERLAVVTGRTRYRVRKLLGRVQRAFLRYVREHGLEG